MRLAEPDPELVERAIVKVLEIAQFAGHHRCRFCSNAGVRHANIRFLERGEPVYKRPYIDCDTVN
jgi:hypothetical protein